MVNAEFTEQMGMDAADDPPQVFGQRPDRIVGFDQLDELQVLFAFQALTAPRSGNNCDFERQSGMLTKPVTI